MAFNIRGGRHGDLTAAAFSPRVAADLANTYVEVLLSKSSSFARQQARGTRERWRASSPGQDEPGRRPGRPAESSSRRPVAP